MKDRRGDCFVPRNDETTRDNGTTRSDGKRRNDGEKLCILID